MSLPSNPITIAADQEIARKYIRYLLNTNTPDSNSSRQAFCQQEEVHPKLLYFNPYLQHIDSLFGSGSNIERMLDMTLRDYLQYHYYYIHQGYRYGLPELQQKWLGHDLIKTPWDCWIYQEIIYETKPDVIVELGVMFGGASLFYANILDLVGHGQVLGIDVSLSKVKDIDHPRIEYIEGSSVAPETLKKVRQRVDGKRVLVIADSDHEKNHVLQEIRLYSPLVPVGGYFVVEDSLNDVMGYHPVPNEGPMAASQQFLKETDAFTPDYRFAERYLLSLNPHGYLLRIKP